MIRGIDHLPTGLQVPPQTRLPITHHQLKLYAEASGDFNAIHLDHEVAQKAGLPGVIAHGMLSMAFMGEYLHGLLDGAIRVDSFSCRFRAKTFPGDVITVSAVVKSNDGMRAALNLETRNQKGEITATGQASLSLP